MGKLAINGGDCVKKERVKEAKMIIWAAGEA